MIRSMTGFGKASAKLDDKLVNIELRSLNSQRGADISVRMPSKYRELEYEWRNATAQFLHRGKIDIAVRLEHNTADSELSLNRELLVSYYKELKAIADEVGAQTNELFTSLLRMPDVIGESHEEPTEEEKILLHRALQNALKELDDFRIREGAVIGQDVTGKTQSIAALQEELKVLDLQRVTETRNRIKSNLEQWIEQEKIDQNRFEQELIYYLEKMDISEELHRLNTHCGYFMEVCQSDEIQKGRKLNFIAQEMGREINTIGSKANHAGMQKLVVRMKDELEKIKEQVNNIL